MKRKPPACFRPNEDFEQMVVVDWLIMMGIHFFAVPNEAALKAAGHGRATKFGLLKKLKRMGLTPGAPDLVLVTPTPSGRFVVVEMKRDANSKCNDNQKSLHAVMKHVGWIVVVGYGAKDAIAKLQKVYSI